MGYAEQKPIRGDVDFKSDVYKEKTLWEFGSAMYALLYLKYITN